MLQSFLAVFEQMFRILILLSVGYILNKMHLIPEGAERIMSRLVTLLFLPAIILHTNLVECQVDSLAQHSGLVLCGAALCLASIGLGCAFSGFFLPVGIAILRAYTAMRSPFPTRAR